MSLAQDAFSFRTDARYEDKGSYYEALLYALRYRCVTIDSMMLLVETMTPDDFDRRVSKK